MSTEEGASEVQSQDEEEVENEEESEDSDDSKQKRKQESKFTVKKGENNSSKLTGSKMTYK